ncbi:restriction endonuclease [Azohydromonas australica]|uniref:restriction endonuclease n=1 Tax=Azohydromonas australica TaxID=364039 RepID=UPI00146D67E0|nr:restriction endonuclease [Azohydromonas australica]
MDFTRQVVPEFVSCLGYSEAETFYEFSADRYRADVVLSESVSAVPWIVLEIKRGKPYNVGDWAYQVTRYLEALRCHTGLVLAPNLLILVHQGDVKRYVLRELSHRQTEDLFKIISRHSQSVTPVNKNFETSAFVKLIEAVECAENNDEKGESLERLAQALISSAPPLACKYVNLQTRSSEIDIVVEYNNSKDRVPLLDELGRFFLVECKNWSKPVGVAPVRDFMGKLDKCKVRIGVLFSKNGVTGVDSGVDALREIQSRFDRDGVYVLVFSLEDVRHLANGADFLRALDKKADNLRFDMEGG